MKMGDHFALPVVADDGWAHERTADGKFVAMFRLDRQAKATAHAINCHDELVEALTDMDAAMCNGFETQEARTAARLALIRARAILTKAKGE